MRNQESITFALMKTVTVFALTFFATSLLVFGQESDEQNAALQAEREENAVLKAEDDLATAYLNSDAGGIARGVTEDYVLTHSTGKITTRADDIAEAEKQDPKYEVFENTGMKVRVHGNTAVVTGHTHTKGTSGGKPFDSQFQFTDTFIKDGGLWRLFAGHVSKLGWGIRKSESKK
jgi:ketosteroid isomerase-like protein